MKLYNAYGWDDKDERYNYITDDATCDYDFVFEVPDELWAKYQDTKDLLEQYEIALQNFKELGKLDNVSTIGEAKVEMFKRWFWKNKPELNSRQRRDRTRKLIERMCILTDIPRWPDGEPVVFDENCYPISR
jgi:hypothetical protein